jgi:hypothetical protein
MSYTRDPNEAPPPPGGTVLITSPEAPLPGPEFTLVRETDARTAMTRGLQEYIEQLSIDWDGGRSERFKHVTDTWAEAEERLAFPSAAVYSMDTMSYGGDEESPMTPTTRTDGATNTQYILPNECVLQITVELWCQDPGQRMAVVGMLEDAFNPVEWLYGFRLYLPHYHGQIAEFNVLGMSYLDSEEDAKRRYRKAVFVLTGRVPLVRVLGPGVRMQTRVPMSFNSSSTPASHRGVNTTQE